MRRPGGEEGFETWEDGEVTLHVGREVLAGHVKEGGLVFHFGMFGHVRVLVAPDG